MHALLLKNNTFKALLQVRTSTLICCTLVGAAVGFSSMSEQHPELLSQCSIAHCL